jgi:hypothetical protein
MLSNQTTTEEIIGIDSKKLHHGAHKKKHSPSSDIFNTPA